MTNLNRHLQSGILLISILKKQFSQKKRKKKRCFVQPDARFKLHYRKAEKYRTKYTLAEVRDFQ